MSSGEHAPSVVLPRARALERERERARTKRASIAPRPSEATATLAARASLVGLVAMAVLIVVCSGHTAILTPDSTRPLPSWLAGPLSGLGPDLGLGGVIAVLSVMCACYWALVALGHRLSGRIIVATVILLHLVLALAPPLLSTDVFSYGAYGRMGAIYSFNPYLFGPRAISFDPWYPLIGAQWTLTPTAYGPLFTAMSYLLARLNIGSSALAYKAITIVCSLGAIGGTARVARRLGVDPVRAVAVVGLNPVLLIYAVGGDHNDLIMLAALVWSILALTAHRARLGGGLIVAAAAVKLTAGIMLPFAIVARRGPPSRRGRRVLVGAVVTLVVLGAASAALFGTGPLRLLGTLQAIQANGGPQSIPGFIASGLGLGRLSHGVVVGLNATLVVVVLALLVAVRHERLDWITATGWAIVALLVTSTFLLPWYVIWLLPFAALSPSRGLRRTLLALTAIGLTSL